MDRRAFLESVVGVAAWTQFGRSAAPAPSGRKAVLVSMLPAGLSYAERFTLARASGFDAVEMQTIAERDTAHEIAEAAKQAGLRIHSVMNADHWRYPLSSGDRTVVDRSVAGMETSLRNAALWGAGAVLLVRGAVRSR